jgi:F0F1-type ATP synthase delta subunit
MYTTILQENTKKLIDDSLKQSTYSFTGVDLVNYNYEYKNNKYVINVVVRSVNKLDGSNVKLMENSLEKKLGEPAEIKMKVILDQEIDALTKPAENKTKTSASKTAPTPQVNLPAINADKTIEYAIKDNLKINNAHLEDFNFFYASSTARYTINITANGSQKLSNTVQSSIENLLESELNRKVVVNIHFNLISAIKPGPPPVQVPNTSQIPGT